MCVLGIINTLIIFSCVSKKELIYFQEGHDLKTYQTPRREVTLRPGDVLNVLVNTLPTSQMNTYSNADMQNNSQPILNGYTISEEGTIKLPVIGKVEVAGCTVDHARNKIMELVGEYFQNASVKVHLMTFNVTVLGEVARPGQYTVYNNHLSFLDGLGLGGDLLPTANRSKVQLIRTAEGTTTRYEVDLTADSLFSAPYYYLQPDDVIYVEAARYRNINPLQPWSIAISSLSVMAVLLNIFINQ